MQSVRQIQRLNDAELEKCVPPNASWHTDYRDTAYIHVGGLPFELSEGDVLTIFSQYGNPVHVSLIRDKETGKSRGFGFLKYEDQRSCDLAVDNLSGAGVLGRVLTVDHARYKLKDGEIEGEGMEEQAPEGAQDDTDIEGEARRKRRRSSGAAERKQRPRIKEEIELAKLLEGHDDDDPMKAYLIKEKREEVAAALKELSFGDSRQASKPSKHRHRRRRSRSDEEADDPPVESSRNGDTKHGNGSRKHQSHRSAREMRHAQDIRTRSTDSSEPTRRRARDDESQDRSPSRRRRRHRRSSS